jgi:hypothetical protein
MHQELYAYVVRDDGCVWDLPTDELLIDLEQIRQANNIQGQSNASVHDFLHAVKSIMRRSRKDPLRNKLLNTLLNDQADYPTAP